MPNTTQEYVEALRAFIKDHDYLNRLLNFKEENNDDELKLYLNMANSFLETMPPFIVRPDPLNPNFPFFSLVIHQATIEALISNSIVQARNDLTYNNGGITVKVDDGNRYLNLLQGLYRMADRELENYRKWLVALNISGGYGGVGSPYRFLHSCSETTGYYNGIF